MESEINDTLEERPELNFAGFGLRFGAYLIDIIPLVAISFVIFYINVGPELFSEKNMRITTEIETIGDIPLRVGIRYLSFFMWIIYCAIMEASPYEGTFGKRALKIKVTDKNGTRLTVEKSVTRNFTKIFSYVLIGLGFIWVLFNKERRGWHDVIANTYVIKVVD
jgi:uncharacterized RDD family membrane protein YckC